MVTGVQTLLFRSNDAVNLRRVSWENARYTGLEALWSFLGIDRLERQMNDNSDDAISEALELLK